MKELGVTLDALAILRESLKSQEPEPVFAALLAEQARASAINVHLRTDRRYIQERDVTLLRQTVKTELNLVIAPSQDLAHVALAIKPNRVTFVPERLEEVRNPHGLDVILNSSQLRQLVRIMQEGATRCTFFIEPDLDQIKETHRANAQGVELSCESYIGAKGKEPIEKEIQRISDAVRLAVKFGLDVAVGNGLTFRNLLPLLRIEGITRFNLGYSIVARSIVVGFEKAVGEIVELLTRPPVPVR